MTALMLLLVLAQGQDFTWSGSISSGKRLTVKNVIGDVRIELTGGNTASVTGTKRAGRHGDPEDVVVRQVQTAAGVTICVVYPGQRNDTRVDFVVRLPAGVLLTAATVSGDVDYRGVVLSKGNYEFKTMSGDVVMEIRPAAGAEVFGATFSGRFSSSFPLTARTTGKYTSKQRIEGTIGDGSARIRVESFSGDVELRSNPG